MIVTVEQQSLRVDVVPGSELLAVDGGGSRDERPPSSSSAAGEASALLRACFPENFASSSSSRTSPGRSSPPPLTTRAVLEDGLGFHDAEDAIWIMLRSSPLIIPTLKTPRGKEVGHSVPSSSSSPSPSPSPPPPLVALAAAVPYHDGLYVCNFCVHPSHRKSGVGLDVLEAAGHVAAGRGLDALLGNARSDDGGVLRAYYERLGATAVRSGMGSDGAAAGEGWGGGHVRLRRVVGSTPEEVAALFERLREGGGAVEQRGDGGWQCLQESPSHAALQL
eukprot:CAMPEP_0113531172 /NCGR_PEP_ID=MMETSP0015_2-20120614/3351_1 /TAXON_ID=2838 /ORGANISM="Odontella" /LENGTH=277 /DNA_ID=CAMNT_0000429983 /DNA_START=64 /DNA_END=898 /DNA_ORIENTATION=- /assembly_acc=CAM_ASM_000160